MSWDFRIIKRMVFGKELYQVHRVFYDDIDKRKPYLIETIPASVIGIEPRMMLDDIDIMTQAFDKPTLYIPEWNSGKQ